MNFAILLACLALAAAVAADDDGRYHPGKYGGDDGSYHADKDGRIVPGSFRAKSVPQSNTFPKTFALQPPRLSGKFSNPNVVSASSNVSPQFNRNSGFNSGSNSGFNSGSNSGFNSGSNGGFNSGSNGGFNGGSRGGFNTKQSSSNPDAESRILSQDTEILPESYHYNYETENNIKAEEDGRLLNVNTDQEALKATGFYEYVGPDNVKYRVDYIADENGFQPIGRHLPTPPPIPEAIARLLASLPQ